MVNTVRDEAAGAAAVSPAASGLPTRRRRVARGRARQAVLATTARVRKMLLAFGLWPGADAHRRPAASPTLRELGGTAPPSLAALADYTRAGEWVAGEQHRLLEAGGKAYGYLIAIPATALLYGVSLLIQRPTRLGLGVFVCIVVWLTT